MTNALSSSSSSLKDEFSFSLQDLFLVFLCFSLFYTNNVHERTLSFELRPSRLLRLQNQCSIACMNIFFSWLDVNGATIFVSEILCYI